MKKLSVRLFFTLSVLGGLASAAAPNGPFGAPSWESYLRLNPMQRQAYLAALPRLNESDFVKKPHLSMPCYLATERGRAELRHLAEWFRPRYQEYTAIYSIGRSGTALLFYLRGLLGQQRQGPQWRDLPFSADRSWDSVATTETEQRRQALRRHLKANGLSPQKIANSRKPILLFDLVFSAQGVSVLLTELKKWAQDEGLAEAVKGNLHFLGLFSGEMMAEASLISVYRESIKESGFMGFAPPAPPTREEILDLARVQTLPEKQSLQRLCSKVFSLSISSAYYHYVGTHGPNAHESFTPSRWLEKKDLHRAQEFSEHMGEPAFVELFYLAELGLSDRDPSCAARLARPQP